VELEVRPRGAPKDVNVLIYHSHVYAGTSLLLREQDICNSQKARTRFTSSVEKQKVHVKLVAAHDKITHI